MRCVATSLVAGLIGGRQNQTICPCRLTADGGGHALQMPLRSHERPLTRRSRGRDPREGSDPKPRPLAPGSDAEGACGRSMPFGARPRRARLPLPGPIPYGPRFTDTRKPLMVFMRPSLDDGHPAQPLDDRSEDRPFPDHRTLPPPSREPTPSSIPLRALPSCGHVLPSASHKKTHETHYKRLLATYRFPHRGKTSRLSHDLRADANRATLHDRFLC